MVLIEVYVLCTAICMVVYILSLKVRGQGITVGEFIKGGLILLIPGIQLFIVGVWIALALQESEIFNKPMPFFKDTGRGEKVEKKE